MGNTTSNNKSNNNDSVAPVQEEKKQPVHTHGEVSWSNRYRWDTPIIDILVSTLQHTEEVLTLHEHGKAAGTVKAARLLEVYQRTNGLRRWAELHSSQASDQEIACKYLSKMIREKLEALQDYERATPVTLFQRFKFICGNPDTACGAVCEMPQALKETWCFNHKVQFLTQKCTECGHVALVPRPNYDQPI